MAVTHIAGAGLAGLACAVTLAKAGRAAVLYESAAHAGGRCRSYFDAQLQRQIDNGNHLLLSGNKATMSYLDDIGARGTLTGPKTAGFSFLDLRTGERWTLRPNRGVVPWWLLSPNRRVPGTRPRDYLSGLKLARARPDATVHAVVGANGDLYERFWKPLAVAALNIAPEEGSARLLWAVLWRTFGRGAAGCRPLVARDGLSPSLIQPALDLLADHQVPVRFNSGLKGIELGEGGACALEFAQDRIELGAGDHLVLAVPPANARELVPELTVPEGSRTIVNAHVTLPAPASLPDGGTLLGLIGGTAEWLFLRGDMASLTISGADALAERPSGEIAKLVWADTARALGLEANEQPPIRIIKERRATFAQTPEQAARRPGTRTGWRNLFLAGDWTDTGLPATIEGAVQSGRAAARAVLAG